MSGLDQARSPLRLSTLPDVGDGWHGGGVARRRSVDLLIYGFCLYLCDRDYPFMIVAEAHRVLKPQAWLAILDFGLLIKALIPITITQVFIVTRMIFLRCSTGTLLM